MENVNCAILRKTHWIVTTYFLLLRHYFYFDVKKIGLAVLKLQEILSRHYFT